MMCLYSFIGNLVHSIVLFRCLIRISSPKLIASDFEILIFECVKKAKNMPLVALFLIFF